jgi:methionine-rich copper-binding protein CopC
MMRRFTAAATLALAFAGLLLMTRPAEAHAELKAANPAPGATLRSSPETIELTFSEPLGPTSTFTLYGQGFQAVAGIEPVLGGEDGDQLTASIPPLAAGTYTVQWNVTGADGHAASGSYAFAVESGSGTPMAAWLVAGGALLALATIAIGRRRR